MTGVVFNAQLDTAKAEAALARLSPELLVQMSDEIGALVASQVQRRIADDKTAPDGTPWAPWSDRYKARITKRNRVTARSLLVGGGELTKDIHHLIVGSDIQVGSRLEYAAVHQFGSADGRVIPARPYLGLSRADRTEIEDLIVTHVDELLAK